MTLKDNNTQKSACYPINRSNLRPFAPWRQPCVSTSNACAPLSHRPPPRGRSSGPLRVREKFACCQSMPSRTPALDRPNPAKQYK